MIVKFRAQLVWGEGFHTGRYVSNSVGKCRTLAAGDSFTDHRIGCLWCVWAVPAVPGKWGALAPTNLLICKEIICEKGGLFQCSSDF